MKKIELVFFNLLASSLLTVLLFIWAGEVTNLRMVDVSFGVGIIFIGSAWLIYASNMGVLDIFVYSTKRFWLVILNKKDKIESTFFDYSNNKTNKVERKYYLSIGLTGTIYLIVSLILYLSWY